MENKLTPELIEKAKAAETAEALLTLARENNIEMTEEEAQTTFEQLHRSGELSDDELDNVAGGGCYRKDGSLSVSSHYCCEHFQCDTCNETGPHYHKFGGYGISRKYDPRCGHCRWAKSAATICSNPLNNKQ